MRKVRQKQESETAELLKDLLITQLARADVPGHKIRGIVGCDMNRVTRIVRHMKRRRNGNDARED